MTNQNQAISWKGRGSEYISFVSRDSCCFSLSLSPSLVPLSVCCFLFLTLTLHPSFCQSVCLSFSLSVSFSLAHCFLPFKKCVGFYVTIVTKGFVTMLTICRHLGILSVLEKQTSSSSGFATSISPQLGHPLS